MHHGFAENIDPPACSSTQRSARIVMAIGPKNLAFAAKRVLSRRLSGSDIWL
jgi:hypothetical protein